MDASLLFGLAFLQAHERTHRVPAELAHLDDRLLRDIGFEPGVGWIEEVEARMQKGRNEAVPQPAPQLRPRYA